MRNGLQNKDIRGCRDEMDEINDIAIGRSEIFFEEEDRQELLLRIRMAREAMGIAKKRKPLDMTIGGMKKPHIPVR